MDLSKLHPPQDKGMVVFCKCWRAATYPSLVFSLSCKLYFKQAQGTREKNELFCVN